MARKRGMQYIPYDYEAAYNKAMKQLRERVVIVEQSLKSYHKRLDGEQHSDR